MPHSAMAAGAAAVQRAYEGFGAHHQQWKLIPAGSESGTAQIYEIANRNRKLRQNQNSEPLDGI
ncbi:hypothetical protein ACFY00_13830 [Kitasatospora sp. NPDC001540]|uniref:hypothetical protein n=1 Tax=Kitasatospora sp. NPDC001540 TaxID=3364014 RepID=UPI0036A0F987